MKNMVIVLLFTFIFIACSHEGNNTEEALEEDQIVSETDAGDFILRLVSEQAVYETGEKITITGKLKYVGDEEELKILHAESPFMFDIVEVTRGTEIPFHMTYISRDTTLKHGQWYQEEYEKQTLYNADDNQAEFMNSFMKEEGFPAGEYEVEVRSEFMVNGGETSEDHSYTTSILVVVRD